MTSGTRLPIRARLTLGYAVAMAVLLALLGGVLYLSLGAAMLDELDTGLRARAATMRAELQRGGPTTESTQGLVEAREIFEQVRGPQDEVVEATPGLPTRLLPAGAIARVRHPAFFDERVAGVEHEARMLVVPLHYKGNRYVIVVGTTMADRSDALAFLVRLFAIGGPLALGTTAGIGWLIAGTALRPVERMRRQAAAISSAAPDQRVDVPPANDEVRALAQTLNDMLERLADAAATERRFLDNASHELRTPLTALKAELDLARSRPRTHAELEAALLSASEETDRLARLANDLLLLSRAQRGALTIRPETVDVAALLEASTRGVQARADRLTINIQVAADCGPALADPVRLRQAVDNLLDNALRFARSRLVISAGRTSDRAWIAVDDDGPGFPGATSEAGGGLGLRIVRTIAESHHGSVTHEQSALGGARVVVSVPFGGALGVDQAPDD